MLWRCWKVESGERMGWVKGDPAMEEDMVLYFVRPEKSWQTGSDNGPRAPGRFGGRDKLDLPVTS